MGEIKCYPPRAVYALLYSQRERCGGEKAKLWEAHQSVLTSNTIARASYAMMRACRRESKYSKSIKKKKKKTRRKRNLTSLNAWHTTGIIRALHSFYRYIYNIHAGHELCDGAYLTPKRTGIANSFSLGFSRRVKSFWKRSSSREEAQTMTHRLTQNANC
jgi:hypothetical protein